MDGAPGGNADALRVVPDGILPILNEKPRTVGAVALLQKSGVFLQRLVFHIVGTDKTALLRKFPHFHSLNMRWGAILRYHGFVQIMLLLLGQIGQFHCRAESDL